MPGGELAGGVEPRRGAGRGDAGGSGDADGVRGGPADPVTRQARAGRRDARRGGAPAGGRQAAAADRPGRRAAPRRGPAGPGGRHDVRQRGARRAGGVGRPRGDGPARGPAGPSDGPTAGAAPGRSGAGRTGVAAGATAGIAAGFGARFDARQKAGAPRVHPVLAAGAGDHAVGDGRLAAPSRPRRRAVPGAAGRRRPPPTSPTPSTRRAPRWPPAGRCRCWSGRSCRGTTAWRSALDGEGDGWRVYEPTSGQVRVLDLALVRERRLARVLGFDRLHAVLLPA